MSTDRMLFYAAVIGMLCLTVMVTHCTYSENQCRSEAIKAGIAPEKISSVCHQS